jgi:hypothetical protein
VGMDKAVKQGEDENGVMVAQKIMDIVTTKFI